MLESVFDGIFGDLCRVSRNKRVLPSFLCEGKSSVFVHRDTPSEASSRNLIGLLFLCFCVFLPLQLHDFAVAT